ncbi:MAG: hypothetical protein K9M54_04610 [Kiritimatiellales bacterium]|nr:hypothetical protein [Kiritimatiellales bacterium]MCF7863520.1 hypothetical protein [Kiritimatiellales bacterium]
MPGPPTRKSGQAIIFLMVVVVVGLLVVVWNFDLHRIITAKIRVRNAADSAALAAARWQGYTLNMIGDLNLIQAAMISADYAAYESALEGSESGEPEPQLEDYLDYGEYETLHELRSRLAFAGPLAAFAVAQQAAFNNGAFHDPELASNLEAMAETIRYKIDRPPYDNAFKEYANLLDRLVESGVAVSSYSLQLPNHPLVQEKFYGAIAQAMAGWWCPFYRYRNLLENYEGFDSWRKLNMDFKARYMLDLKLDEFDTGFIRQDDGSFVPKIPSSAVPNTDDYLEELYSYLGANDIIAGFGDLDSVAALYEPELTDVQWHVYDSSWAKGWPRATYYDDETDERGGKFPIRADVRPEYDYMGAEAGFGISAPVGRGILASSDNPTVELVYKTKAKAFGFLDVEDPDLPTGGSLVVPHYFGFVFPAFQKVRLVHSDIGDKILNADFYRHVTEHLGSYLEAGPSACRPDCQYCRLLIQWETLDRQKGLEWLEKAYADPDDNPCKPEEEPDEVWGKAGGGATGGS